MQGVVSVVVPCFDEAAALPALIGALETLGRRLEAEMACGLEIVLVDDGSRDGTWGRIETLAAERDDVRGVRLSRNFGQQAAMTCGYATATGDAVVCLDADLQDPPELIVEMVRRWRAGADVVFAVRRSRSGETWFKRATAAGFYRVIRAMGAAHVRADTGDFRLLSRRAVDALLTLGESSRFLRGMVGWLGFHTEELVYDRAARVAGATKWPVRKMARLAADAIVGYTQSPLRLAYYLACGLSVVFLGYLGWRAVAHFVAAAPLAVDPGVLLLAVIAFGAANLLAQAVQGEYLGRLHQQCLRRPLYIVQERTGEEGGGEG
jgi:polyisoprenyl-phosphate glycosyltransferase